MYAEKVAACYDPPQQSSVGGHHPPQHSQKLASMNFVYDFVLMYHRASLSVVILLQFLLELCLFVNLEYSKYTVFRTFLLHALTY